MPLSQLNEVFIFGQNNGLGVAGLPENELISSIA